VKFIYLIVRKDILDLDHIKSTAYEHFSLKSDKKVLLVLGGSLGALTLNDSLKAGVERVLAEGHQVIWQTGKFYIEDIQETFKGKESKDLVIKAFIARMDYAYACADVVISRAGALSISELCLTAKPSILVPSPNVAEDHQTKNAMALVNEKAAILVKDIDARAELIDTVLALIENRALQTTLSQEIRKLGKPNAATEIAKQVRVLAE